MKGRRNCRLIALGALWIEGLALSGCSTTQEVAQRQMMAPATLEVATRHEVAIVEFTGRRGQEVSDRLSASLERASLDGRPVFTLHGPIQLVDPWAKSVGPVASAEALNFARSVEAKAVLMGETGMRDSQRFLPDEVTVTCVERAADFTCLEWETEVRECVELIATLQFAAWALDATTGSDVYQSGPQEARQSTTECKISDRSTGIMRQRVRRNYYERTREHLRDETIKTAVARIHQDIAPYVETFKVSFLKVSNRLTEQQQARFAEASDLAGNGYSQEACEIWRSMAQTGIRDVAVAFNLAACAEEAGAYLAATEAYDAVYRLIFDPAALAEREASDWDGRHDLDEFEALLETSRARARRRYEAEETLDLLSSLLPD